MMPRLVSWPPPYGMHSRKRIRLACAATVACITLALFTCGAHAASNGHWRQLTFSGATPTPRLGGCAIYDSNRQRMLMFGGEDSSGLAKSWVWSLDLNSNCPTWDTLSLTGTRFPNPREYASAAFDRQNNKMYVYGGLTGGECPVATMSEIGRAHV